METLINEWLAELSVLITANIWLAPIFALIAGVLTAFTPCSNLCLGNAISFPDLSTIRDLYKKEGIWSKVKKDLEENGKLIIKED